MAPWRGSTDAARRLRSFPLSDEPMWFPGHSRAFSEWTRPDPRKRQGAGAGKKDRLVLHRAGAQENSADGEPEADREHRFEESVLEILTDASDFAGRCHLHAQNGICAFEAGERELRRLNPDVVELQHGAVDLLCRAIHDHPGGQLDEIHLRDL